MKQIALNSPLLKETRKQKFLKQMDQVVPWLDLVNRITPYYPECNTEHGPLQLQTLLRTHCMQQWFELSDSAMKEAFSDTPLFREFAQTGKSTRMPDERTIMRFRHRLEKHNLAAQIDLKVSEQLAQHGLALTPGMVVDALLTPTISGAIQQETEQASDASEASPAATPVQISIIERDEMAEGRPVDAELTITLSDDEMAARITLTSAQGGKPMLPEDIVRALHVAGVVKGIDAQAIAAALTQGSAEDYCVASGTQPVHGNDALFEVLFAAPEKSYSAADTDERIDYRDYNSIALVAIDQPLMRRIPATPGIAGFSVTGRELAANAGQDAFFAPDLDGAKLSDSDSNILLAAIAGHPVAAENGVRVEPFIRLSEVNLSTGNINFVGFVQVDGDVTQGMKIKATGDILVGGVVERSFIETDGDILIKGGVIGDANLNAAGTVRARFAQSAAITAGKNIEIDEMAMECYLLAQDHITVGLKSPQRGRLVGGLAQALLSVKVPFLGSEEGGLTRVVVGVHEALENQFRSLQFTIFDKQNNLQSLQKIIQQLSVKGDPKNILERAKTSLLEAQNSIQDLENQSNAIDEKLTLLRKSNVEVTKETSGSVEVTVANYKVRLAQCYGRGHFSLSDENRIVHIDPKGFSGLAH